MSNKKIYPQEGEEWTGITPEALEEAGFVETEGEWRHPKCDENIFIDEFKGIWCIQMQIIDGEYDPIIDLRVVKYLIMRQIPPHRAFRLFR